MNTEKNKSMVYLLLAFLFIGGLFINWFEQRGETEVERKPLSEIPATLGEWRQQLRLMRSLRLLALGVKISRVAMEAGYSTPSAFIAMFRKTLGTTPSRYFAEPVETAPSHV